MARKKKKGFLSRLKKKTPIAIIKKATNKTERKKAGKKFKKFIKKHGKKIAIGAGLAGAAALAIGTGGAAAPAVLGFAKKGLKGGAKLFAKMKNKPNIGSVVAPNNPEGGNKLMDKMFSKGFISNNDVTKATGLTDKLSIEAIKDNALESVQGILKNQISPEMENNISSGIFEDFRENRQEKKFNKFLESAWIWAKKNWYVPVSIILVLGIGIYLLVKPKKGKRRRR